MELDITKRKVQTIRSQNGKRENGDHCVADERTYGFKPRIGIVGSKMTLVIADGFGFALSWFEYGWSNKKNVYIARTWKRWWVAKSKFIYVLSYCGRSKWVA